MAISLSGITYAGEAASGFIVKALTGAETIGGGHIFVKDGIKYKYAIPRFSTDVETMVQDYAATPTTAGTLTLDQKSMTLENYNVYTEFNPRSFESHWEAINLNEKLIDTKLPVTAESVIAQEIMAQHAVFLDKIIWQGDKSLSTKMKYIDGIITKAVASGDTISIGSPAALTSANILAKLQLVYDAIPAALKYSDELKIYVNYTTFDLFMQAQIAQTYKGVDVTSLGVPTFRGIPVVKIYNMPANTIFVAKGLSNYRSNLWLGLNSMADTSIQLDKLQANSDLWFFKMEMKLDVQIGWNQETVLYKV